jgi:hypothetical protein
VRNLVVTGSPDPAVHLAVGSVGFPYAHFRLIDYFGFSVAHYWNKPHVWRTMLIPGLSALGDAWPGLLAVVAAGAASALFKRSGLARLLGLVTIVSAAVYVITPTTAIGYDGGPSLYAQNLRYLTPALATGLILVALFAPGQRYRWQVAVTGLIATILVVTLLPGTWSPWPTTTPYTGATVLVALASGALLVAAARLPSLRSRLNRPRAAVALSACVCIAVAGGALLNHRFQTRRYAGGDALYSWVQHNLRHARIAIAGLDRQYPLYRSDWSNYVQYVGTAQLHGGFTVALDCRAWEASLASGRFDYVVTRDDLLWPYTHGVPELGWTALTPGVRVVFEGAGATILHLSRPPHPGLCPPGSNSSPAAPRRGQPLGSPAA